MPHESLRKTLLILMLGLLTVSAFFLRLDNFIGSKHRSIDETVYYRMAGQVLDQGLSGYNTILYSQDLLSKKYSLPDYFFQPVFKHPPLFTLMTAISMKKFGKSYTSAAYVSLFFGALLIPLVYFLGALVVDRKVGFCSAVFLWIDPVNVMTSQKIWMDTTLTFFMLLAILLFVVGLKQKNGLYFIFSGLSCGLAVATKYTGILAILSIALFVCIYRKDLLRSKFFLTSLVLPFAALIPWFYWNFLIYGKDFLRIQNSVHHNRHLYLAVLLLLVAVLTVFGIFIVLKNVKKRSSELTKRSKWFTLKNVQIMLGIALVIVLARNIGHGLHFTYLPRTSWESIIFKFDPPTFYLAQLLEYSFIYFFAFASFFVDRKRNGDEISLLRYGAVITLVFFIMWGSYQSRYILFAIPLLAILAFDMIFYLFERISNIKRLLTRLFLKSLFILLIMYSFDRMLIIDLWVSFPNKMCYF